MAEVVANMSMSLDGIIEDSRRGVATVVQGYGLTHLTHCGRREG